MDMPTRGEARDQRRHFLASWRAIFVISACGYHGFLMLATDSPDGPAQSVAAVRGCMGGCAYGATAEWNQGSLSVSSAKWSEGSQSQG
jgi:hypothetical protein